MDHPPARAGGARHDDEPVTQPDDGREPAPDLRAPRPKRFYLLVASVIVVGGGALVELLTGDSVVLGVLELIVAVCIAIVVIDEDAGGGRREVDRSMQTPAPPGKPCQSARPEHRPHGFRYGEVMVITAGAKRSRRAPAPTPGRAPVRPAAEVVPAPARKRPAARKPRKGGDLVGYARVSTAEQDPALQLDALNTAGCWRVFTDHASGSREDRPELAAALDSLRPGDTLVVWRLDRLGRSLPHLIDTVTALADRGVGFGR